MLGFVVAYLIGRWYTMKVGKEKWTRKERSRAMKIGLFSWLAFVVVIYVYFFDNDDDEEVVKW